MLFERIERELADGEFWDSLSMNRIEYASERLDTWEIKSIEKQTYRQRFLMPNFRFWRNWTNWKRLFPVGKEKLLKSQK